MIKIMILDGQGGGIGKALTEKIRECAVSAEIIAIGTNAIAANAMLKAGADVCVSGENPVTVNAPKVDFILGPLGIIAANSLYGEITPKTAEAVTSSSAMKILIPQNKCNIKVAGLQQKTQAAYISEAVAILTEEIKKRHV